MAICPLIRHDHPVVKTILCAGTPYKFGLQHGLAAAEEVHNNVATYTTFFQETAQITWSAARERAVAQLLPTLKAIYPQILEEMAGIADGAGQGLTREDILTLNVRSEIALTDYADGCTAISKKGEAGELYVAQNWDWLEELQKSNGVHGYQTRRLGYEVEIFG